MFSLLKPRTLLTEKREVKVLIRYSNAPSLLFPCYRIVIQLPQSTRTLTLRVSAQLYREAMPGGTVFLPFYQSKCGNWSLFKAHALASFRA